MPIPMMIDGYVAERAFNRPLLIEMGKAKVISSVLENRLFGNSTKDLSLQKFENHNMDSRLNIVDGVAIIPITGTLLHRGNWISAESGTLTYTSLRTMIIDAANNPSVKSILLDIDSGGGEVDGNFELASLIREINDSTKPVVAVANGSAFSGAFSLGVAAGKFYVTPTGGVGSVGVIIQHIDFSKRNEIVGVKITNVVAGEKKAELSSDFPLSDSARQMLQDEVNRIADIFVDHVSEMRGIDRQIVLDQKAGLIFGEKSVRINFVDGIASFDDVLNELKNTNGDINMPNSRKAGAVSTRVGIDAEDNSEELDSVEDNAEELDSAEDNAEELDSAEISSCIVDACNKAGIPEMASGYIRQGLSLEDVNSKIENIQSIKHTCKLAGKPERATDFISSCKTLKQVQEELIAEMSDDQNSTDISSTQSPDAIEEDFSNAKNVILDDVKRRQNQAEQKLKGEN
jgi:signal peptide peptidase SppA